MRLFLLFFLLMCWSVTASFAASDSSTFHHFTTNNGLPSNNVYSVIRDRSGFIWVATDNGIAKYDGYTFKVFTTQDGLPTNDIWQMFEDPSGKIWLFCNSFEIGYMKDDKYHPAYSDLQGQKLFPLSITSLGPITAIFFLKKGRYHALISINNRFVAILLIDEQLLLKAKTAIFASRYHKKIWTVYGDVITQYDLIHPGNTKVVKMDIDIATMVYKANGSLIDDQYYYFFSLHTQYLSVFNILNGKLEMVDMNKLGAGNIITCYQKADALYIITTKGIYKANGTSVSRINIAAPTTVQTTYFEDFGDKWICTNGDGIWIKQHFTPLKKAVFDHNKLYEFNFIGSERDTAFWWHPHSGVLIRTKGQHVIGKQSFTGYGTIRRLSKGTGRLIMLSNTGTYAYSPNNDTLTNFFKGRKLVTAKFPLPQPPAMTDTLTNDSLKMVYYLNERQLFNVSDSAFVISGNYRTDHITYRDDIYIATHLITDHITGYIVLSPFKWHCLYSARNIYLYSKDFRKKNRITYRQLKQLGIDNIQKIATFENDIYILTLNSLFRFRPPCHYKRIETGLNLSSASMSLVNDHIILLGDFGIAYRHTNANPNSPFRVMLNNKHLDFGKILSRWVDTAGNILFTTDNHAYYIHFDSLSSNNTLTTKSNSLIQFVTTQRATQLHETDTIQLTNEQLIHIKPVSLYGSGHFQIFYAFDTKNIQSTSSGDILATNIAPGKYYTIRYYLQDEFWRTPTHTLRVIRLPLWYQRTEWKIAFVMAILAVFGGAILIAFRVAQRMTTKANEKRRLQTELELRAIHAQINPHFIYNTLSTALFFISKQQTQNAYEHVAKFSKLLRNYLKSSRERFITLAEEIEMLTQYIELQRARFSKSFQYELNIAPEIRPKHMLLPSLLLQPLVENAINHGLFNKSEGGFLKINFLQGQADDTLICIIEDNGIGRRRSMQYNAVKTEKKSYGTALTQDLINILERYESMDIKVEYLDKTEPETGTIVKLTIHNIKTISSSFKAHDDD